MAPFRCELGVDNAVILGSMVDCNGGVVGDGDGEGFAEYGEGHSSPSERHGDGLGNGVGWEALIPEYVAHVKRGLL